MAAWRQSGGIENLGPATRGRPRGRCGYSVENPLPEAEAPRDEGALTGIGNNTPLIPPPLGLLGRLGQDRSKMNQNVIFLLTAWPGRAGSGPDPGLLLPKGGGYFQF